MKKTLLVLVALAASAALLAPGSAAAHPLGNFTINHYAGIEVAGDTTYVHLVLDLAEIPTVQVGDEVRSTAYPARLARSLELSLDGARAPLRVLRHRVRERAGAGGLTTLRLDVVYEAVGKGARIAFRDASFGGRIGWREIALRARDGASVTASSVPATSASDELRAYPRDLLRSPLDVREAQATVSLGSGRGRPPSIDPSAAPRHEGGGFESLVGRRDLSVGVVALSLLIAAFWGAVHALTPGHGKALVAGYLIGARGRPRDAVLLGVTVTVTHTAGVFGLGLVTLGLSRFIVPERVYPWLTLASGLLVVAVGISVLLARLRGAGFGLGGHDHDHHHETGEGAAHDHDHHHHGTGAHHHHAHDRDARLNRRGILGVGIAAGLLPCPSALVVLLAAIALHRVGFGLALIVAFSLGLAMTITAIGLVVVLARGALRRISFDGPVVRALPAVSALVIVGVGIGLTIRALPSLT